MISKSRCCVTSMPPRSRSVAGTPPSSSLPAAPRPRPGAAKRVLHLPSEHTPGGGSRILCAEARSDGWKMAWLGGGPHPSTRRDPSKRWIPQQREVLCARASPNPGSARRLEPARAGCSNRAWPFSMMESDGATGAWYLSPPLTLGGSWPGIGAIGGNRLLGAQKPKGPKGPSLQPVSAAILCTGGLDVIRKEAWPFYRTLPVSVFAGSSKNLKHLKGSGLLCGSSQGGRVLAR